MRAAVLLSAYWFFLLGGLGTFFPFYSLYLNENAGLSGSQVGLVMAVMPLVGIVAQPLWGQVADRTGSRTRVLAVLSLGASAGFALLYTAHDFASLLTLTAVLAVFSSATIPTCVAVSMALLGERGPYAFGLVRAWGTVGFLIAVVSFPLLLDWIGGRGQPVATSALATPSEPALAWMLPVTAACYAMAALLATRLPSRGSVASRAGRGEVGLLLRHRPFLRLLAFMFLCYLFLQGPMVMFPLYVRSLGGSVDMVSRMWVLMLLLEIPLVALSGAGFRRLGGRGLLAVGVASGAVRWLVSGLADELWLIYAVQVLHGVSVVGLIIGGPLYVEAVVPERLRSTGQGVLSMMGISLGGILSTLASGALVDRVGASAPAVAGGVGALVLTALLPWMVPAARRADFGPTRPAGPATAEIL